MTGPIEAFLTADHAELDALLNEADARDGSPVRPEPFERFRQRLLKHIGMEEKVLLRFARERRGGEPLPLAAQLRLEHGRIVKLLVPSPTPELCAELRAVLAAHNPLEEGPSGLYAQCDALAGAEAAAIVLQLRAMPDVPTAPHYDGPLLQRGR